MAHKILVVEDEPTIADTITYSLETEGFECLWCATGSEALTAIARELPRFVVLDVGLPDMNGFELCKQIRARCDVPLIFLTARADEIDRVVGLEIGADDYVVKPFSPRELAARVKAILRRSDKLDEPTNTLATRARFSVDEARHRIAYYGKTLTLSRYEYRLLCVFIRRPGWVFTRDQLMDAAWDEPDASSDRTVDAHIKSLRAKMRAAQPDREDPIQTHRGVGYALRDDP